MRVLQICAAYKPAFVYGGPTMSVSMLSEQLAKAGIDTHVFATTANGKAELPVVPNLPTNVDGVFVTYFTRLTKDHSHFSPALLKKVWQQSPEFDMIHIHTWWNLVSIFSCAIALLRKVPVVISPRGTLSPYSFQNKNNSVKWLIHNLLSKPLLNRCYFHVTSQREDRAIAQLVNPKSMVVLPNFVKLPEHKIQLRQEDAPCIKLIFFSRIEEKKGLEILLRALPLLTIPYQLTIAGNGDEIYIAQLKVLAAEMKATDKINWVGFRNNDKFEMLHEHDLFVLPSYDENFGNVVIESLSTGTAVLITDGVGLADYVTVNKLGWVCQTDSAALSGAINNIAQNKKTELERIRLDAPGIIYSDFNEDNLVHKYISMYQQIVKP
ncbi:XrtY-associated glycosyltransferase XYAG1 [Mucilaginibacter sp.]|uniref:XrtY-associated glycosyltransferase XYAG1 n=1 Tax=Mucilaginibacter sp. TaxID=1882438 RepID=UPI003D10750C